MMNCNGMTGGYGCGGSNINCGGCGFSGDWLWIVLVAVVIIILFGGICNN